MGFETFAYDEKGLQAGYQVMNGLGYVCNPLKRCHEKKIQLLVFHII